MSSTAPAGAPVPAPERTAAAAPATTPGVASPGGARGGSGDVRLHAVPLDLDLPVADVVRRLAHRDRVTA
ncbi:hypothetical protein WIS52_16485 [Pseudonocardia nematodicida]|uniref:Uncharacterized protein n=1 Tax=Pseudonocardia nematodicida TaxID=1206997 RepID=A0ABV1KDW3_9PSEU